MREASPEEAADTLAYALTFKAGKRTHDADRFMAAIVAERLVEHLKLSGFVLVKKPPSQGAGHPESYRKPYLTK
jgi:hypothetical protein